MTVRYSPTDVGHALVDAEDACRRAGAAGLQLTRLIDGWVAMATLSDGRRFHRTVSSGIVATPDAALSLLADRVRGAGEDVA